MTKPTCCVRLYAGLLYVDAFFAALASSGDCVSTQSTLHKALTTVATVLPVLRLWHIQRGKAAWSIATWSVVFLRLLAALQTILSASTLVSQRSGCCDSAAPVPQAAVGCGPGPVLGAKTAPVAVNPSDMPDAETFCDLLSKAAPAEAASAGLCLSLNMKRSSAVD